jgi:hypothetical protein
MNELQVESNTFTLEILETGMFMNLDACFLSSRTDTAYFKPGIPGNIDYLLITQDSLLNPLNIDPSGDEFSFHYPSMAYLESITFGDSNNCQIRSPLIHQSICLNIAEGTYYLDNTPTLGAPNDYTNATGTVDGYVTNLAGDSLEGVQISGKILLPVFTNSSGYFNFSELAILEELLFQKAPYPSGNLSIQIWPDSLQTIHLIIENLVGFDYKRPGNRILDFQLFHNYPNPFNSETTFEFYIPLRTNVKMNIYDLLGKKIRSVLNGTINSGWHSTSWDSKDDLGREVGSGIYIYQLLAGQENQSGKIFLVR